MSKKIKIKKVGGNTQSLSPEKIKRKNINVLSSQKTHQPQHDQLCLPLLKILQWISMTLRINDECLLYLSLSTSLMSSSATLLRTLGLQTCSFLFLKCSSSASLQRSLPQFFQVCPHYHLLKQTFQIISSKICLSYSPTP